MTEIAIERPIRVLHILPWVNSGGPERRRLELARRLPRSKFEQGIACLRQRRLAEELREAGVEVLQLEPSTGRFGARALFRLVREVRRRRPDIVHGAVFEGVILAALAGRLGGARYVVLEETGDGVHRRLGGKLLMTALSFLATRVLAVSRSAADHLVRGGIPESRITIIENGIAVTAASAEEISAFRQAHGLSRSDFVVVSVGRVFDGHKRFSDLIRALAIAGRAHPELKLLIVGDGPDRAPLEQLAGELGVAERVVFTGYLARVPIALGCADVFALVSERESFGVALVEAMQCGLPTIATEVGGMREIAVSEETTLTVPPFAPERIAEALQRLVVSPELRARLGAAGKARAEGLFGGAAYARRVESLYEDLALRDRVRAASST